MVDVSLKVTSHTTLQDLEKFAQEAGEGAKIRAKKDMGGGVTLYASPRGEGKFDWLMRLFGMGRQDKREAGQQAIETILKSSSGLNPGMHDRLLGNVFEGRRDGGGEMRTEHLRELVQSSRTVLETNVSVGDHWTYEHDRQVHTDDSGSYHLYRDKDGSDLGVIVRKPAPGGSLQGEVEALQRLQGHPNVESMDRELTGPDGRTMIVQPRFQARGDELLDKIDRARVQAPKRRQDLDSVSVTMLQDVAQGLKHLHSQGVSLPRIDPGNLRMNGDGEIQIGRLDLAREAKPQDEKEEMFQLGLMAYRLFLGPPDPFAEHSVEEFRQGVTNILWKMQDWYPGDQALHARIDKLTPFQKSLINDLLHPDPGRRPTVDELLDHPALRHDHAGGVGARQYIRQLNQWL